MTIHQSGRRRAARGVTLIELMLVLGLSSILVAMAGPELRRAIDQANSRSETRAIADRLELARSSARSLMSPTTVSINGHLMTTTSSLGGTQTWTLGASIQDATFDTANGRLTFNARGGLDLANPATLLVHTRRGDSISYVIYPAIGAVRMP